MIDTKIIHLAKKVCEFLKMNDTPEKSDCILVLGSFDERVAIRGAELYLQGYAPLLYFPADSANLPKKIGTRPKPIILPKLPLKWGCREKIF